MADLGIDVSAQDWQRSGSGAGAIEVAFVGASERAMPAGASQWATPADAGPWATPAGAGPWVLMRVAGDPAERVLVYDRFEWECFLDGAKNGEFDDAT